MSVDPGLLDDLVARGLVQDTTDRGLLAERLSSGPITVYLGVDPTADSLHVGNLVGLLTLRRFQMAGHRPIPLAGGATGMIGDPSGKSVERNLLDDDALAHNLAGIVPQLKKFIDFDDGAAKLLDNRAWTVGVPFIAFLRDVGKHVTVNQMVAKESVKSRMSGTEGLSYTEFSYMLLQAFDYWWLAENEGCELQIGGSDQWGNISLGIDLVRRRAGKKVHGLTWPLLVKKDGTKYGKTAEGDTIWLSAEHMSTYRFYQSWIQAEDDEVRKLLCWLTFLSLEEIDDIMAEHLQAPHKRVGQRRLAAEVTTLVHDAEATRTAEAASAVIFGGSVANLDEATFELLREELPTTVVPRSQLAVRQNLVPALVAAGVAKSNGEAMRLLKQRGVSVNDQKVDEEFNFGSSALLHERYSVVRRGKKSIFLLVFE